MPEKHRSEAEAAEKKALELRAQMRAARQAISQAAARALAPEPRSFRRDPDDDEPRE